MVWFPNRFAATGGRHGLYAGACVRDLNKHFQYLWRFNAVAMAVICLAIIVAFAASALSPLWSSRNADVSGTFAAPKTTEQGYTYKLGSDAIRLAGTSEALFVLRRWKSSARDSASPEASAQDVNLLAVNGNDAGGHWLLRGTDQRIMARDELHVSDVAAYNGASPVTALVLTVAEQEHSGADAGKDRESLYLYRVGSPNAVRFFTADRILANQQIGADRYVVIYENGKTAGTDLFSLVDFRLLSNKPLPDIPE